MKADKPVRTRTPRGGVALPLVLVVSLALFSTGAVQRPAAAGWAFAYDVVLYNVIYITGAVIAWRTARRSPREGVAWRAIAVALLLNTAANLYYTLFLAHLDPVPIPSVADVLYLASYPALYVALISLIRSRVPRFHPSMWLDGLIGALGATALAVALVLAPSLKIVDGPKAAVLTNLAYPIADVLLLAVLFAVGAILGVRRDRTLLWIAVGLVANLVGDTVYLNRASEGTYIEGGWLDLTWLLGVAFMAWGAHRAPLAECAQPLKPDARVGWRVLLIPLACNGASLALLGAGWGDRFNDVAAWCAVACVLTGLARTVLTFNEVRDFQAVKELALTDELTGLPNRRALLQRAAQTVAAASSSRPAALLLLDLDGFKEVNDSLGHHAGDQLLRELGPRLAATLKPEDLLARLGGDEFAIVLPNTDLPAALTRGELIRDVLLQPVTVEGIRLHVGVSIGIAGSPVPASSVSELLRCADIAMYAAKRDRGGVQIYVPEPGSGTVDALRTMDELRTALQTEQIDVHVQPQVSLATGQVTGVEALVRWHHPTRGLLSPSELLPAAEKAGLLQLLAARVLDRALCAAASWWTTHKIPIAVNLAAIDVADLDLPAKVTGALHRHGLPPRALTLELVEDTLIADPERGRTVLGQLRALGVRTSIDDYGTGYSSLAYLDQLPADELKLDRTITAGLTSKTSAVAIIRHTTALAHDLGLTLVAEGVEDFDTLQQLAELGCDTAQGFAVAHPMPVQLFVPWLQRADFRWVARGSGECTPSMASGSANLSSVAVTP